VAGLIWAKNPLELWNPDPSLLCSPCLKFPLVIGRSWFCDWFRTNLGSPGTFPKRLGACRSACDRWTLAPRSIFLLWDAMLVLGSWVVWGLVRETLDFFRAFTDSGIAMNYWRELLVESSWVGPGLKGEMLELFFRNDCCLELAERGTVLFFRAMFRTELSVGIFGCGELDPESSLSLEWVDMVGKAVWGFFEWLREWDRCILN